MARVITFKKCLNIMIDIEKYLTKNEEITIDASQGPQTKVDIANFVRKRSGILNKINNDSGLLTIKVLQRGNNAHAIILVKNEYLTKGWSIFDANGKQFFPFRIIGSGSDVTGDYLEVTGSKSLNYGSEVNNPGYCGTIGVIFMIFFLKNKDNPEWPSYWSEIVKKLSVRISQTEGTLANILASQIQKYLSNVSNINDDVINKIYEKINNYLQELNTKKATLTGGVRTSTKRTQKQYKEYDSKHCNKQSVLLENKEKCREKSFGTCGKNIYLENGQYFYCRNYKPLIGSPGCDYLSTVRRKPGICIDQDLIKKFTTTTQHELFSRLTQLKNLGYTKKIYNLDNAQY